MQDKAKNNFLKRIISGFFIGLGAILPGVSGGILALSLGIYRDMINAVSSFFKHMKINFLFLLPIAIGAGLGVLSASFAVEWLMNNWFIPVMFIFSGFVLGGVPSIIKDGTKQGFKWQYILCAVLGAAFIIALSSLNGKESAAFVSLSPIQAVICGAVVAFGTVIPGISSSFILLSFNLYTPMLSAFNSFEMLTLLFFALGFAISGLVFVRIVKKLFDAFPGYSYFAVLGFLIGSVAIIFPMPPLSLWHILYAALFAIGFLSSYFLGKMEQKSGFKPIV